MATLHTPDFRSPRGVYRPPTRTDICPPARREENQADGRDVRDVGLGHLARRLGRESAAIKTLVALVRQLTIEKGFPPPLGFRKRKGALVSGADAICATSRWPRVAVEAWFDNTFPAHAEAQAAADDAEWATRLDSAAASLVAAA